MKVRSVALAAIAGVILMGTNAFGQTRIGFFGAGAKLGYVNPEDIESTFGFGLAAKLVHVVPQVAVDAFLDYWSKSYELVGKVSYSQIAIGAVGKYYFHSNSALKPYAGAGLAFNIKRSKVEVAAIPGLTIGGSYSQSDTDLGIHFVGGAEYGFTPTVDGFAEVKYAIDGADYLSIMFGAIYKLRGK